LVATASSLILSTDVKDAVGVNVKGNLNLRDASRSRSNAGELNLPRVLLCLVRGRSPSKTWMRTPGWLSAKVENVWLFLVGMVVLRAIKTAISPPAVSIPRDRGATSRSKRESVFSEVTPVKMAAWTAAP